MLLLELTLICACPFTAIERIQSRDLAVHGARKNFGGLDHRLETLSSYTTDEQTAGLRYAVVEALDTIREALVPCESSIKL